MPRREPDATTKRLLAAGTDYPELPGRHVTVNQVVAYNMAYYRKAAGLTQEELGERLGGWVPKPWSKAAVSAAERSWDGKRVRQFDADLLFGLARVLDIPVSALFLPPDDDGLTERYIIDPPYGGAWPNFCATMHDLLTYALSDPTDEDQPAMNAYRGRLASAGAMYFGTAIPEGYMEDLTTEEQLVERAERLRSQYEALRGLMGDIGINLEHVYERMREEKTGPAKSDPQPPQGSAPGG